MPDWLAATRPQFLTISVVAVLVGFATALTDGVAFDAGRSLLTLLGALLVHAGANMINDFHDRHADAGNSEGLYPFTGGSRLIQRGTIAAAGMARLGYGALALAALIGAGLALADRPGLWAVGAIGLLLAIAYSAPPLRVSARGAGEAVIAAAWLLVVVGSDLTLRGAWSFTPVAAGMPLALLIAAILLANGFPDRRADEAAGKHTLVVRLGPQGAGLAYIGLVVAAALWLVGCTAAGLLPAWVLIALLPLPMSWTAARRLRRHDAEATSHESLLPALRATIATAHLHGLLVVAGLVAGR
jgi:1,4-dihydroxy-2-naphthoate octaprenyltransferase